MDRRLKVSEDDGRVDVVQESKSQGEFIGTAHHSTVPPPRWREPPPITSTGQN